MVKLFYLVEKIQGGNHEALEQIIHKFEPKVKSLLRQTTYKEMEDLRQELLISIILKTKKYNLDEVPGFEEFRNNII